MGDEATGSGDGSADAPTGIDRAGVEAWFAEHVAGRRARRSTFERISGGHSNLTYRVTDAASGQCWALRRPPLGKRLGSAHDMGREHKVVSALGPTAGAGRAGGRALRGRERQRRALLRDGVRRGADPARPGRGRDLPRRGRSAGDRRARSPTPWSRSTPSIPTRSGLGDLGRKEDYVARQLRRWQGQWEKSKTRELAAIDQVHERLAARIPEQGPATIVHGDYRLDNMILTPDGRGRRGRRLGALHARRPARRRRPADGLLARARRAGDRARPAGEPGARLPHPRRAAPTATPSAPAATSPNSTSSSRSATGSWRSSSRASTPATPPASTARLTMESDTSPKWLIASPTLPLGQSRAMGEANTGNGDRL